MKISIDTKEDSHDDIRRVIKMLQNLIGDSQEVLTNQPISESSSATSTQNAFNNIFGDTSSQVATNALEIKQETKQEETESTKDLFAELFSEEEIKKMDTASNKDDDEEEIKPKGKRPSMEFY